MEKNRTLQVRLDLDGSSAQITASLMGIAFFLRIAYYLGFTRPEALGVGNLLVFLILPMLLEGGLMVLLRGVRLNAPGLYGILGAVYCVLLIIQSFQYGSVLRTVLAVAAYLLCGGSTLCAVKGLLNKSLAAVLCFLTAVVRVVAFDLGYLFALRIVSLLPEAAAVSGLLALGFLSMGLKVGNKASGS